jgi:hypothetical protein
LCGGSGTDAGQDEEKRQLAAAGLTRRVYEKSKKLWVVVGPTIFNVTVTVTYSMTVLMHALCKALDFQKKT